MAEMAEVAVSFSKLTKLTEQKMYVRLWDFETADCRNRILSREGTIISYLALLERLFPAKQTKKEKSCLLGGGAGRSPRDA